LKKFKKSLLLFSALLSIPFLCTSLISCASNPTSSLTSSYTLLAEGQSSGFTLQKTFIIESAEEFSQLWSIHMGSRETPVPIIDFTTKIVIAGYFGEQHTAGYSIKVGKIIDTEQHTQVIFKLKHPKPGSLRAMLITQPFIIFSLEKKTKPIRFNYIREPQ